MIESARHCFLMDIHGLVKILRPSRSLYFRVLVQRRLPEYILVQALCLRYWSYSLHYQLLQCVTSFRSVRPPRYTCPRCSEPFTFQTQLVGHRADCCPYTFSHYRWIRPCNLVYNEDIITQVVKYVSGITALPDCFSRPVDQPEDDDLSEGKSLSIGGGSKVPGKGKSKGAGKPGAGAPGGKAKPGTKDPRDKGKKPPGTASAGASGKPPGTVSGKPPVGAPSAAAGSKKQPPSKKG